MVLYGVYYGAYKIAKFYISAFSAFHHTSFYLKKRLHIRISVYFDHFIRVLYERRYASHMSHRHLCTVTYPLYPHPHRTCTVTYQVLHHHLYTVTSTLFEHLRVDDH